MAAASSRYLTESETPPGTLTEVHLLGLPLDLFADLLVHDRELLREMELIARRQPLPGGGADSDRLPPALVELAGQLAPYGAMGAQTEAARDAAAARGQTVTDLSYHLPTAAGPACARLLTLLEQADTYCRDETLLTLPTTAELTRLRAWFLTELARQCAGLPPTAWPGPTTTANMRSSQARLRKMTFR
jgi:hypothetical protein